MGGKAMEVRIGFEEDILMRTFASDGKLINIPAAMHWSNLLKEQKQ